MNVIFDFRVLALIFAVKAFLQALGLLYLWQVERRYAPVAKWALGSLLAAAGTMLIAVAPQTAGQGLIFARSLLIYCGLCIFGVGILEACGGRVPWRAFGVTILLAFFGHAWFTLATPMPSGRFAVFTLTLATYEIYIGAVALAAPADPLRGTRRLIGSLVLLQAGASSLMAAAMLPLPFAPLLRSPPMQIGMLVVTVGVSFLLALALAVLTGQRTTTLLSVVLANLDQGVALFDKDRRLVICNERYGDLYGVAPSQLRPGTSLLSIVARRIANGFFAGTNTQRYFEEQTTPARDRTTKLHHLSDGRSIVVSRRPMQFGGWLTTHADVSAVQRIEQQVAYLAHHDPLTGLANRQLFGENMCEAIERLAKTGEGFAVLLIDLDRFKAINDTLGHPSGDALLAAFAERLRSCVAPADIVARLGGDEFAIVQMVAASGESTLQLARQLLDTIGAPYEIDRQKVMIGASIGIARAPDNGVDVDQLMRNADLALYRSKAEGRSCYRFYDRDMDAHVRARHALELALRNSVTSEDFLLEYQPVFNVERRCACAVEALVRWRHPSGTVVPPTQFIGIAEETGLIVPLGEWILRQACTDALAWPEQIHVSVNLSVAQFANGDICGSIEKILHETGLPARRIDLEVTESILLHSSETVLTRLHRLKKLGVSIVLDDFGTGYSSLNYLTKFPFDQIKIDKSFIVDLGRRGECLAIVAAIIGVARSLGMEVTAEGVETTDQYELLRVAGCRKMQGYLFARPGPAHALSFVDWEPEAISPLGSATRAAFIGAGL